MLGLAIGFAFPAVLTALIGLPLIWYWLKITPPRPVEIPFPPLRLILDQKSDQKTSAHLPWWLLALRLVLAALIVMAMAGPVLNPLPKANGGNGALLVLMDSGWPAAPDWDQRVLAATQRLQAAARAGQPTALMTFQLDAGGIALEPASDTLAKLRALKPLPYVPDRMSVLPALKNFLQAHKDTQILWLADGLNLGRANDFARALNEIAPANVLVSGKSALALADAANSADHLQVKVLRADDRGLARGVLTARDKRGLSIGTAAFDFKGALSTIAKFDLPLELRNQVNRIDMVGQSSAGAVSLLDGRNRRKRVGIINGDSAEKSQPLLSPTYYLTRALAPFAQIAQSHALDPYADLIAQKVSMLVLADVGRTSPQDHQTLSDFVENGGVLVRFAGVNMAGASDDLLPVRLRSGDRTLGGAMSWETPKKLAPFDAASPFFGLRGTHEVTVERQVLAEPDIGLRAKTWAMLEDGTPLVTAQKRGKGMIILVHVSADPEWSNLPLSGLFVDMLRKFTQFAHQSGEAATTQKASAAPELAPTLVLDGFGVLGPPPANARPIPASFNGAADALHPPGYYGPLETALALNTLPTDAKLAPADYSGSRLGVQSFKIAKPVDLRPALLVLATLLLLLDSLASLWLSGHLTLPKARRGLAAGALMAAAGMLALAAFAPVARADTISANDMDSVLHTRLAYIITGDAKVDRVSKLGLQALSRALDERTSLSPGAPAGLNPATDEMAFYPLIYWPIVASAPQPTPTAVQKIAAYMKHGGTILFDTRDALLAREGDAPTPRLVWLRKLLTGMDVPPLERVPSDHVVTKTFYLINRFVGRYASGDTWIQALPPINGKDRARIPARAGDGVSPIILTSNDLCAGWAMDENDQPLYPLVPGGGDQREMAFRGGINLVMYTLTGNYKADQVHVHDLLQRLSH